MYIVPFLLLCTRICGLFDDAHIILGYTALGDKMISKQKIQGKNIHLLSFQSTSQSVE
jgi:hypothetical protein